MKKGCGCLISLVIIVAALYFGVWPVIGVILLIWIILGIMSALSE